MVLTKDARSSKKSHQQFWDKAAKNYDRAERRYEELEKKTIERTKRFLQTGDVVLNFGSGPGTKTLALAGSVTKITGIDISTAMIDKARKKLEQTQVTNVEFKQGTLPDPAIPENSFDVILAFNILHLVENQEQIIADISRLLKPEGLFLSSTPCLKEKMSFKVKFFFSFYGILTKLGLFPDFLTRFTFKDLERLLENSKFTMLETEPFYKGMSGYFVAAINGE